MHHLACSIHLRWHLQSSSSSSAQGPSSSSRAIIIIRIWIAIASWKLEHSARADIVTRICYGAGNRRQLVSDIAFSARKLRRRVAMKMMFMSGRYVIFPSSCRRVRWREVMSSSPREFFEWFNVISDTYGYTVVYSEIFRVYITLRFFYYSYYYFAVFSALFSFIANHFPSNLRCAENWIGNLQK